MKYYKDVTRLAIAGLVALTLGACAGPLREVGESDRDTSGQYDGRWVGTLEPGIRARYNSGTWTKTCTSGESLFYFDVADGKITVPLTGVPASQTATGFVNDNGGFRVSMPRGTREVRSRETGAVGQAQLRWIFSGRLNDESPKVKFMVGDSHYGGGGCSWNLEMSKS